VSTEEKAALVRSHGCDHPILYTRENVVERVKELTGGQSVPVVYDSVGKDTFFASLECLRPRGLMVSYGNSSGAVPPISLLELSKRGSLYVTRPTLMNYTTSREELLANAAELFEVVASGAVKIEVNQTYALKDAAQAHRDLEARKTTGSTVLIP
jgi:NADPH2:quinone reductase